MTTKRLTLTHLQAACLFDAINDQLGRDEVYWGDTDHQPSKAEQELADAGRAAKERLQRMLTKWEDELAAAVNAFDKVTMLGHSAEVRSVLPFIAVGDTQFCVTGALGSAKWVKQGPAEQPCRVCGSLFQEPWDGPATLVSAKDFAVLSSNLEQISGEPRGEWGFHEGHLSCEACGE